MRAKGQAGMEFLMVASGFLAFLAVSAAALSELNGASMFALDVKNASAFVQGIEAKSASISLMGEGSRSAADAVPLNGWEFTETGGRKILKITGPKGKAKEIRVNAEISLENCAGIFSKKFTAALTKTKEGLSLDCSYSE